MEPCPCGSTQPYSRCCEPLILGEKAARTPEELMRARYSAYAKTEVDFIVATTHPEKREDLLTEGIRRWSARSTWQGLEIIATETATDDQSGSVEFIAHYTEKDTRKKHHERAQFDRVEGTWYFSDGVPVTPTQVVRAQPKVGRNEPCPCGSRKKYKKCCEGG
jgi:SEC-C motif domain protein